MSVKKRPLGQAVTQSENGLSPFCLHASQYFEAAADGHPAGDLSLPGAVAGLSREVGATTRDTLRHVCPLGSWPCQMAEALAVRTLCARSQRPTTELDVDHGYLARFVGCCEPLY